MKKFSLILVAFLVFFANIASSQNFGTASYRSSFSKALKHMKNEEYRFAYSIFQNLYNDNPGNSNLEFHMGVCLMDQKYDKDEALIWLNKANNNYDNYYKANCRESAAPLTTLYYTGLCYIYEAEYDKAKQYLQDFIDCADVKKEPILVRRAKEKLDICDNIYSITPPNLDSLLELDIRVRKDEEYYAKINDALEIINLDHVHALKILNPILEMDPNNYNLNYFIGIACLNIKDLRHLSPVYLSKSVEKIDPRSIKKNSRLTAAPMFANYYLGLAWYENGRCDLAVPNYRTFQDIIGNRDPYAYEIVEHKISLCDEMEVAIDSVLLADVKDRDIKDFNDDDTEKRIARETSKDRYTEDENHVEVQTYFYAVQVGAGNINPKYFDSLRKLDRNNNLPFPKMGTKKANPNDRMRRFIIGKFTTIEEATPLLDKVKALGYEDAFIGKFQEHALQE